MQKLISMGLLVCGSGNEEETDASKLGGNEEETDASKLDEM
jgi:hypothetical protein